MFLVQLSSFGGLGVDPVEVEATVAGAKVPVAVWVGPRAAEAAGAATFALAGADVVGVARDARVGPAFPAELGKGRDPAAEAALFARSGLPPAVRGATLTGAAAEAAGLADYQAESLPDAVRRLDGQAVDGRPLEVSGFQVRFLSRSLLDRVRHGLANPALAYLLLLAAAACLSFEWFQLGFGVAGAAGRSGAPGQVPGHSDLGGDPLGGRHRQRPLRLDQLGADADHRLVPLIPFLPPAILSATVMGMTGWPDPAGSTALGAGLGAGWVVTARPRTLPSRT